MDSYALPRGFRHALKITAQESAQIASLYPNIEVSALAKEIIEQLVFSARESSFIDAGSGVSARWLLALMKPINDSRTPKIDWRSHKAAFDYWLFGTISAIAGKVEPFGEGEREGAQSVAENLLGQAVKAAYERYFEVPKLKKNQRQQSVFKYSRLV